MGADLTEVKNNRIILEGNNHYFTSLNLVCRYRCMGAVRGILGKYSIYNNVNEIIDKLYNTKEGN
ncbi:MAG TPA: hypothetical protein DIT07_09830 [Sphingobacteriaceae bacterium]|nr:hypothetical protein [Sphingobacteriaceae bacterium]